MIRYRTAKQDQRIFKLLALEKDPKVVWRELGLTSVSVVYNAIRRHKEEWTDIVMLERRKKPR